LAIVSQIKSGKIENNSEAPDLDIIYKLLTWVAIGIVLTQLIVLPHIFISIIASIFSLELTNPVFNLYCGIVFSLIWVLLMIRTKFLGETSQYHGAEHMVAQAYEAKSELALASVKQFSPYHPRCGTSLITLFCIFVPIIFYQISYGSIFSILVKVVTFLITSSVLIEMFRLCNRYAPSLLQAGLWLQRLTVSYPDDKHLRVAIISALALRSCNDPDLS
jgi:uncharacterized protein YqhQ